MADYTRKPKVMIVLDTSALIGSLTDPWTSLPKLRRLVDAGETLRAPTLVLYEWRRGPRTRGELASQEALVPGANAISFGVEEALEAAKLYRQVRGPRGREVDLAIAACAIVRGASLWTLNRRDFADVAGLKLLV